MNTVAAIFLVISVLATVSAGATEMEDRRGIDDMVAAAFASDDFARLDAVGNEFRRSKSRTSSGLWHLTLFYAGLVDAFQSYAAQSDQGWTAVEHRVERWTRAFPNSPTAHVAYAMALIEHAWFFRGSGYSDTVPPDAWAPFREYVQRAYEYLAAHKAEASPDPRWYETMLVIARLQGWDEKSFRSLLDEALAAEPEFYQTYFAALDYLLPQWHGDVAEVEKFANEAVVRTWQVEGASMYARIYWYASQSQFGNDIFADSLVVWPKMRTAFDDVIKRYPDAWNMNNYARFACLAGDRDKTRQLVTLIGTSPLTEAWTPLELFAHCRAWAMNGRPAL